MLIKTLLNKVERFKSFVYGSIGVQSVDGVEALVIDIELRRNSRLVCPECGPERRAKTLLHFLQQFGKERCAQIKLVCGHMGSPYLKIIAKKAPLALNILDRFHIM